MLRGIVAAPKPRGRSAGRIQVLDQPAAFSRRAEHCATRPLDNYPIFRYMILVLAREGRLRRRSEAERAGKGGRGATGWPFGGSCRRNTGEDRMRRLRARG